MALRNNSTLGSITEFIKVTASLCDDENMRITLTHSLEGGLFTGSTAALGGLLLGPIGLAIGGIIGGLGSAVAFKDKFKPVAKVICELNPRQKEELYQRVMSAVRNVDINDVAMLAVMIVQSKNVKQLVLREVANYVRTDLNLALV